MKPTIVILPRKGFLNWVRSWLFREEYDFYVETADGLKGPMTSSAADSFLPETWEKATLTNRHNVSLDQHCGK
jgi:hypothetical protein